VAIAAGIERLKYAMQQGLVFITSATEPIVERLYDVLNNRAVEVGALRYFRIAADQSSQICEARDGFRFDF
jgi:hypothetical protein